MRRIAVFVMLLAAASAAPAADPVTETVRFSREGGLLLDATVCDVAAPDTPGAVVRFTVDGTVPAAGSPAWSGPIDVTGSLVLRAAVFSAEGVSGPVASRRFLRLGDSLASYRGTAAPFSSSLPVIVASTFGGVLDDTRAPRTMYAVATARGAGGRAVLGDAPDYQGPGSMHVRGHSSARFDQLPYAWETQDEAGDGADAALLGMPEEEDWVLSAPWSDKSLLRNALAYSLARDLRGVEDYRGVYLLIEKVKRDKHRVNVAKLTPSDTDPAKITGGYVFRRDKPSDDPWFLTSRLGLRLFVTEPDEPNEAQLAYLTSHLDAFETALDGDDFADPLTGYAAFVEPATFIDNYWFVEALKQVEGFRSSTYFAKDRGGRIRALPIWDYDLSLGNASFKEGETPTGWYHDTLFPDEFAWYGRMFEDPAFALAAWDRWWQLRAGAFSDAAFAARVLSMRDALLEGRTEPVGNDTPADVDTPAARHFRRWPILGADVWPNPPGAAERTTYQSEVDALLGFAKRRFAWIDAQCADGRALLRPPRLRTAPGEVAVGTRVALSRVRGTARHGRRYARGDVWFTQDGTDPRAPDGSPRGERFRRPFRVDATTTVKARLLSGGSWGPLAEGTYTVR